MQVIDVHALDAEIFQTTSELILQEFRRHAVAAGGDIFRGEDSGLNVLAEKILVRVGRHGTVGRQVTALRAHHDFLAFEAFRGKLPDGSAEASLAALKSVIDCSVHHIEAALHRRNSRRRIALIRLCVRLPEVCANPHGREHQAVRISKMACGGTARELLRVARCSFFGCGFGHDAPSGGCAVPAAGSESAPLVFGARSREHARRILRYGQSFSRKKISPSRGLL